jgi:hypothetical protein
VTEAATPLQYAPRPPALRNPRLRRYAILFVVGAMVVLTVLRAPRIINYVLLLRDQRQCMAYVAPPTQVVLETDPVEAKKLLAAGADYLTNPQGTLAYLIPPQWLTYYTPIGGGFQTCGTVFLHERTSRTGVRCLVAVDANVVPLAPRQVASMGARIIRPGSVFRGPRTGQNVTRGDGAQISFDRDAQRLTIFAGQPDPNDLSHFTIDYELDGARITLDGWLEDEQTVKIEIRE